jgi:hypothetical protein
MTEDEKSRHDLKNHLAIILGFSEVLLAATDANDERRADLEQIHTSAGSALDLIEHLFPPRATKTPL